MHYGASMPRRSRGNRMPVTVRLPFDLYREVAVRAQGRNWSMSDYVGWCVGKELSGKYIRSKVTEPRHGHNVEVVEDWVEELENG